MNITKYMISVQKCHNESPLSHAHCLENIFPIPNIRGMTKNAPNLPALGLAVSLVSKVSKLLVLKLSYTA